MPTEPLLDRGPRRRAAEHAAALRLDPAADPLLAAAFDPGLHVRRVRLTGGFVDRLWTREHVRDPDTGAVRSTRSPLAVPLGNGLHLLPVGLLPLLGQYRGDGTPAVAAATPVPAGVRNPLLVRTLAARGRLVVRHTPGVGVSALIADLVAGFPGERVAVLCSRRRDVGDLARRLKGTGLDARGFYEAAHSDEPPPRVAVGTVAGLTSSAARHEGCGLVVVTDPVPFVGPAGLGPRLEPAWVDAKWVGLLPHGRPPSPLEQDRLVAFFGPTELVIPAPGQVAREVLFAPQGIAATGPITAATAATRTLTGVTRNAPRNRLVMALARDLADRLETPRSRRFGVVRDAADLPGGVTVLATNPEHRRRLHELVPAADRERVRVVPADGVACGSAEGVRPTGVLVRADGGSGLPPLPAALLVEPQTARRPLLVVDVPVPHPAFRAADRSRERAYRAAGWAPLAAHAGGYADWERWGWRRSRRTRY